MTDEEIERMRRLAIRLTERADELRAERKQLITVLHKLKPAQPKAARNGAASPPGPKPPAGESIADRILAVVATDTTSEWTLTDIISEMELAGWTTTAAQPANSVQPAADKLVREGRLGKPRTGVYRAAT